jgi:signal transduction histidine kinase
LGLLILAGSAPKALSGEEELLLQLIGNRAETLILHSRLLDQVRAGRARAQILSQQLMQAQEAERRKLARELHDEIGQALTAVKINLQAARALDGANSMVDRLDESIGIVDQAIQQVRNLSFDLRPSLLDDLGLVAALRWYLDRQAQRVGYSADFVTEPREIRATPGLETVCFRVVQEALTNIARHARASHVRVELDCGKTELRLLVRDDGVGFDVANARRRAAGGESLGLLGMQERVFLSGGRIDIDSALGKGTEIGARFPLDNQPAVERRRRKRAPG